MRRPDTPPRPVPGFGRPFFFDLTAVSRPAPPTPTVYYLVPEVEVRDRPTSWRTVAGFGAVITVGLGLGLLLAHLLL